MDQLEEPKREGHLIGHDFHVQLLKTWNQLQVLPSKQAVQFGGRVDRWTQLQSGSKGGLYCQTLLGCGDVSWDRYGSFEDV